MQIDTNFISIVSSVVSVILGFVAGALAIYFFVQAKNTEKETSNSLERINAQTEALQKLAGRWMDRLTKYVTEPKQTDELLKMIIEKREIHSPHSVDFQIKDDQIEHLTVEAVSAYIGMYYYSALSNALSQYFLPKLEDLNESENGGKEIKNIVDQSYKDFNLLKGILDKVHKTRIECNPLKSYYLDTVELWAEKVKDSTMVYAEREKEKEN